MLIAEEYLLLTMRDDGRSTVSSRDTGVAGALLCELASREEVMVDERGRLRLVGTGSTGDEVLDEALLRCADKEGRKPKDALAHIGKGMPRQLLERLARAEVVQERPTSAFGVRMWSAWPLVDTTHRDALRTELVRVLRHAEQPDARTGSLVSLLQATDAWGTALPREHRQGLSGREISRAAKEIAEGRWASDAVARAVAEVSAAAAAVVVAVSADGGASS